VLTVVMPVYNAEHWIARAIDSVLVQTFGDFRLLIADDGSRDGTLAVARSYEPRDPRVRVMTHPNNANLGIAHTMNAALDRCETEWVACMHGDDLMLPNRLERQLAFLKDNPDLSLASALVYLIDGEGRRLGTQWSPLTTRAAVADFLRRRRCIAFNHPCAIFRLAVVREVGGYRQDFWPAEDADLWNRIAEAGHGVLVQPECLLEYRIHGASASISRARLMIRKTEWITQCIERRQSGVAEPTWDEFLAARDRQPLPTRMNLARKETARTLYQTSKHYLAGRHYPALLCAMAAAAALEPGLVLGQVLPRLGLTGNRAPSHRTDRVSGAKGVTA
jgi:glycosyltransferase involved in cell wall biosynthesis